MYYICTLLVIKRKIMRRKVSQWVNSDTVQMSKMSQNAIMFALSDAKLDIIEMAGILENIAYPRIGTKEESMTLQEFAEIIQRKYSLDELCT